MRLPLGCVIILSFMCFAAWNSISLSEVCSLIDNENNCSQATIKKTICEPITRNRMQKCKLVYIHNVSNIILVILFSHRVTLLAQVFSISASVSSPWAEPLIKLPSLGENLVAMH